MKGRITNILSFKNPINKNNRSLKINNKFKKSSTTQYNYINKNSHYNSNNNNNNNPNAINSINNNIFLNLFNRFNNTSSLRKNTYGPKQIISNRINNSQISKERKNLNIFEVPSSSSIKRKSNNFYDNPSLINSMNFIDNHGHINIRLNLKNQFINNNSNNYNNITDVNFDIGEKLKEKDLKIIQLQNELLKSQEIINNLKTNNTNIDMNMNKNKCNYLNNSSQEKNLCILTKSSESVDKILKTAFNAYTSNITTNNLTKKKSTRKNYKNSFLKRCGNKNILECIKNSKTKEKQDRKQSERDNSKTNRNIYSGYYKKKQSDYLRLFLPLSNFNSAKPKFNSYSNDKKNIKSKNKSNNMNLTMNKTVKNNNNYSTKVENDDYGIPKNEEFFIFSTKCEELKKKTKNLLDKYIDLGGILSKSSIK